MVGVGSFAMAVPSVVAQSPLMADVAGEQAQRAAAAAAAEQASAHHRNAVVAAAAAAAEQAQTVSAASGSTVPAETLTQLDEAAAELDRLLLAAGAAVEPVAVTDPTAAATASPAAAATASPTATQTATTGPTAAPTSGAAEPSPAASVPTGPSADPSTAITSASVLPAANAPVAAPSEPAATSASTPASLDALAVVPAKAEDATTKALRTSASKVAALTAQVTQAVREQQAATDASAAAEAEAARVAAEEAATRAAQRVSLDKYANGRVPAAALCELTFAPGAELRCDAAGAIEQLDLAYRQEFGTDLVISDSYRSYSSQVACRRTKGSLCAQPGTSNHGLGKAVDLGAGAQTFGTKQHRWLLANAEAYGWTLPSWARAGGSKPEPWHWEYVD
jgi:LAS superfamily LD-carboxypeptidase LdcB